ncbi:MAG: phosphatase PAP2 family protein [candidate division Zixibacteria bacterium]|nr:phosphatase PAP2 family protein [candidate division Zixibacteria bacterium]
MLNLNLFNREEKKFPVVVLILVILFFIIINQVTKFRPDHAFLALLIVTLSLGKEKSRRFLIDWAPLILFWIAYDMMRGVADSIRGVIQVEAPYRCEYILFSHFFGGKIPPFWFQDFQALLGDKIWHRFLDIMIANIYTLHFAIPVVVGWIFWHTTNDRSTFYRYFYTLTVLNAMALITFMLYPAAPPWYVYNYGFVQPAHINFSGLSAGSLINVDKLLGTHFFATVWDSFNPNHFAAIPSLHGAYPIATTIFLYQKFHRFKKSLIIYCIAVWFGAVYLNHHYVIDLIIGAIYLVVSYFVVDKILYPFIFARFLEKHEEKTPQASASKVPV